MYPYHWHHYRGGSRILWFIIGAGSAAWWMNHYHRDRWLRTHCLRPPISASNSGSGPSNNARNVSMESSGIQTDDPRAMWNIPKTINNIPPAGTFGQDLRGDDDRMAIFTRQAAESMTDLTEATLDTVLNTAQKLKAKLAETRAQREKEQQELQRRIDEEKRNPPHLV